MIWNEHNLKKIDKIQIFLKRTQEKLFRHVNCRKIGHEPTELPRKWVLLKFGRFSAAVLVELNMEVYPPYLKS